MAGPTPVGPASRQALLLREGLLLSHTLTPSELCLEEVFHLTGWHRRPGEQVTGAA
jgi:hypothetical protein